MGIATQVEQYAECRTLEKANLQCDYIESIVLIFEYYLFENYDLTSHNFFSKSMRKNFEFVQICKYSPL